MKSDVNCQTSNMAEQVLQTQCEHGLQNYKDLSRNPDNRLKKIIL